MSSKYLVMAVLMGLASTAALVSASQAQTKDSQVVRSEKSCELNVPRSLASCGSTEATLEPMKPSDLETKSHLSTRPFHFRGRMGE